MERARSWFLSASSGQASMANQKFATYFLPSFPRKRESIGFENKWIPARARLRGLGRNDGNLCNELAKRHTRSISSIQQGRSFPVHSFVSGSDDHNDRRPPLA